MECGRLVADLEAKVGRQTKFARMAEMHEEFLQDWSLLVTDQSLVLEEMLKAPGAGAPCGRRVADVSRKSVRCGCGRPSLPSLGRR
jgi:hypothetical protein